VVRLHLEYTNSLWFRYKKGDTKIIGKVQKRATKLIMSLKHLPYTERIQHLMLPTLKCRCLHGDMIEVVEIVHDFYHLEAAVKRNFNTFSTTRGNKYKLQKSTCHYNL